MAADATCNASTSSGCCRSDSRTSDAAAAAAGAAAAAAATAATVGDLHGNLGKLRSLLRRMHYPAAAVAAETGSEWCGSGSEQAAIVSGAVDALLPILHFALCDFSANVHSFLLRRGFEFLFKSDRRFVEEVWKFLRQECGYRPLLTPSQFLTPAGFAERKLLLCCDLLSIVRAIHNQVQTERRRTKPLQQLLVRQPALQTAADVHQVALLQQQQNPLRPPQEALEAVPLGARVSNSSSVITFMRPPPKTQQAQQQEQQQKRQQQHLGSGSRSGSAPTAAQAAAAAACASQEAQRGVSARLQNASSIDTSALQLTSHMQAALDQVVAQLRALEERIIAIERQQQQQQQTAAASATAAFATAATASASTTACSELLPPPPLPSPSSPLSAETVAPPAVSTFADMAAAASSDTKAPPLPASTAVPTDSTVTEGSAAGTKGGNGGGAPFLGAAIIASGNASVVPVWPSYLQL
ncbi:centrosomal protein of 44 kDa [Cyclospora cayetanensis]|uniref:Centrosomal protein of 44 kDa n=1 Tax=Cyclospora cayetanensis TaxID=88456 RepID=A0A6P6S055_9EIME|nr:centrosomal protein of 44 kDa [Cyclospora cayetanensis]